MNIATREQLETLDLAFAKLLRKPEGSLWVTKRELRFELGELSDGAKDKRIQDCVDAGFFTMPSVDELKFTAEGLFQLSDPRPAHVIEAMLGLLRQKYEGSRVLSFDWSELVNQDKRLKHVDYQNIAWLTAHLTVLANGWVGGNGKKGTEAFESRLSVTLSEEEQETLYKTKWTTEAFRKIRQRNAPPNSIALTTAQRTSAPQPKLHFLEQTPVDWSQDEIKELHRVMLAAYSNVAEIQFLVVQTPGVSSTNINWNQPTKLIWKEVIETASKAGRLRGLMEETLRDSSVAGYHSSLRVLLGSGKPVEE
jgi:hypothetical protein